MSSNNSYNKSSKSDVKKIIFEIFPPLLMFYFANKLTFIIRTQEGDISKKLTYLFSNLKNVFSTPIVSLNTKDILVGLACAGIIFLLLLEKRNNAKKMRKGREYGSARWGTAKDIKPFLADDFKDNIILTQTEGLTMKKPSEPKYARNKNVLVIGGSGSGKTRFFIKPNIMQMHSSYVVTDPNSCMIFLTETLWRNSFFLMKIWEKAGCLQKIISLRPDLIFAPMIIL